MASSFPTDRVIDAMNRHDADGIAACYSESSTVHDPAYPEPLRGRETIRKDAADFFAAFPDLKFTLRTKLEQGESTAIEIIASGTHQGPLPGPTGTIPASNRRMTMNIAAFDRVDSDGRIIEERRYYDVVGLLQQLGAMPEPSAP